jgi:hypothetical protein
VVGFEWFAVVVWAAAVAWLVEDEEPEDPEDPDADDAAESRLAIPVLIEINCSRLFTPTSCVM